MTDGATLTANVFQCPNVRGTDITMSEGSSGSGLFREKAVASIDSGERFDEAIVIVPSRNAVALGISA